MKRVNCPICVGQAQRKLLLEVGKIWDIYECDNCGCQFIYPIPNYEELPELYRIFYAENIEAKRRLNDPSYGRLSFPRQWGIIRKLVNKSEGMILDYGCGGGHFLDRVSSQWDKWGVEIAHEAIKVAREKRISVVSSVSNVVGEFDVITMFAVIEHLPNPKEVVAELSRRLKDGGLFVIMTGDVSSVKAKRQSKNWHLYTPPGHIFFFTAKSVDWLMNDLGYDKIKHLYTDGGVTKLSPKPINLALRVGIEAYHRIPILNTLPLFDTYYGYYVKKRNV